MLGEICLVPRVSNLFVDSKSLHTEGMNLQIFTVLNVMRARRAGAGKAVQSTEEVDAVVIGNLSMLTRGEGNTTGGGGEIGTDDFATDQESRAGLISLNIEHVVDVSGKYRPKDGRKMWLLKFCFIFVVHLFEN